jgi:4-carboxymuconolactone decarboxylase
MVVEGYGKVLGRPGLELRVRELCIAALLAVLDAPVQLRSHLRGALNSGAGVAEVEEAMRIALAEADDDAGQRARDTWTVVRARWEALAGAGRE